MLNSNTESAIKLCVIAALVDGWTDDEELTTAANGITNKFGENPGEVSNYTQRIVGEYRAKGVDKDRGKAIVEAIETVRSLCSRKSSAETARSVLEAAREVVRADGWEDREERDFLDLLGQILRI